MYLGRQTSRWLITGEVNLDHLVELVSAGFLHCNVTVFSFYN